MTQQLLIHRAHLLLPLGHEIRKDCINTLLPTGSFLEMHLSACMMSLMISTVVNIQIHFDSPSSHTNNSSMSSLTKMLMASISETDLSIEDIEELIGMQSYAVLLNRISVISDFRFYCIEAEVRAC